MIIHQIFLLSIISRNYQYYVQKVFLCNFSICHLIKFLQLHFIAYWSLDISSRQRIKSSWLLAYRLLPIALDTSSSFSWVRLMRTMAKPRRASCTKENHLNKSTWWHYQNINPHFYKHFTILRHFVLSVVKRMTSLQN